MGQKQFYQGHPISSPFVRNSKGTGPLLAKERVQQFTQPEN